jgi:hypothetical protein
VTGFFSQDCAGCGHPLVCDQAIDGEGAWMNEGVAVSRSGVLHAGAYDGYGHLGSGFDGGEQVVGGDATVWHRACWEVSGKPCEYRGTSEGSEDQGWFFTDGDHDLPDPRTTPWTGRCRVVGVHRAHRNRGGVCPGQPCEHDRMCCASHGVHSMPPVGCIFR